MKTIFKLLLTALLLLYAITANAQLKVQSDGKVRIGGGTVTPGAPLEVQESNKTTELRVLATTNNDAIIWGANLTFAYGFGVGADGKGYIWQNVNNRVPIIKFENNKTMFDVGNYDVWIDYNGGGPTIRPSTTNTGYLGTSSYMWNAAYFSNLYRVNEYILSDKKVKFNIKPITSPLATLLKLNGVTFDYTAEAFGSTDSECRRELIKQGKNRLGFIAQEVKEVLPSLVIHNDSTDLNYINYDGIIPILVESVKELDGKIHVGDSVIQSLEERIQELETELSQSKMSEINTSELKSDESILYQNSPNPFNNDTEIRYRISDSANRSVINLYNLQGIQIKSYTLNTTGASSLLIHSNELQPGQYLYTLIVDGREVGTKKMILTN
ncbi:MAG: tail fiber domain-containing protein [Bacteroidales bacterium]